MIDLFFIFNLCFSILPVLLGLISFIQEKKAKRKTPTMSLKTTYLVLLGSILGFITVFLADVSNYPFPLSLTQLITLVLLIGSWVCLLVSSNLPNDRLYGAAVAKWMRRNVIIIFSLVFVIGALLRAFMEYTLPPLLGAFTGMHFPEYIWDRGQYYTIFALAVIGVSLLLHYLFKRPLKSEKFRKKHNLNEKQTDNLLLLNEVLIVYITAMLIGGSYLTIPLISFLYVLLLSQKIYQRKTQTKSHLAGEDRFFSVITAVEKYPIGQFLFRLGVMCIWFVAFVFPFFYPIINLSPFNPSFGLLIFFFGSIIIGFLTWILIYFTTNSLKAIRLLVIAAFILFLIPIFDWWANPLYLFIQGTFFSGDLLSNIVVIAWLYFTVALFIAETIQYWLKIEELKKKEP